MQGLFSRITTFIAAFKNSNLIPRKANNFDDNAIRLSRYSIFAAYVDNEIYSSSFTQSAGLKIRNQLYTNIRAILNMTGRVVDLFAYYVYVGNIDMEHMTGGAIPLVTDDERVKDAARQAFTWSNWNTNKELLVRMGATFGDAAIKIVDDRQHEKVRMEILDPCYIVDVDLDDVGNIKNIAIEYEREEDINLEAFKTGFAGRVAALLKRKTYTYTEIISKTEYGPSGEVIKQGKYSTYKDGVPFAYYTDTNGVAVSEWDNEYGFVPVVLVQHTKTGLKWGANAFYKVLHKIDELNDQSSLLNDQIRKAVVSIFAVLGAKKKDMEVQGDDRDKVPMLFFPVGADIKPIQTVLDVAAVNGNMAAIGKEIENDLPILALQQIRSGGAGNFTEPGVNAAFSDAVGAVNAARANYDHATVRALQMVMTIGGYNGYEGFQGFNLDSYDKGDLDFSIKNRPVISVSLSVDERITLLSSVGSMTPALQKVALREMGYADDVIDEVEQGAIEAQANAVKGAMQGIFGHKTGANGGGTKPQVGAGDKKQEQMKLLAAKAGA